MPAADVELLLDRAFGPDRHARTAYRLRDGVAAVAGASLAALDADATGGGRLIGTIQLWPVLFVGDAGLRRAMTLVGPVAVAPDRQQGGLGRRLMTEALVAAAREGLGEALMLVGDPGYYGRFFGFDATRTGAWRLPGPVERHRLLARGRDVPAVAGDVVRVPSV